MEPSDIIGAGGVFLILVAFVLNLAGPLDRTSPLYLTINLIGASLACFASVLIGFIPFVVLEAVWAAAALFGLLRLRSVSST